jgi:hypothetical protein
MRVHCHRKRGGGVQRCTPIYGLQRKDSGYSLSPDTAFPRPFGNDFELGPLWLPQVRGSHTVDSSNAEQAHQ